MSWNYKIKSNVLQNALKLLSERRENKVCATHLSLWELIKKKIMEVRPTVVGK